MDLALHIGSEKTGTTSLQFWLDLNTAPLRERGIFYCRSLGRTNNRRISYYGLEPGTADEGLRRAGVRTADQHGAFAEQIGRELIAEVREAREQGCTTFVISNEHCHSRLKTAASVQRVHDLLAPLFDTMRVYCFLRPQMDVCLSLASTMSRNGQPISRDWMDKQMRPVIHYYNYSRVLELWSAAFGAAPLVPVAFSRQPDSIAYFEQVFDVADIDLRRRPKTNAALDYRVIALVNAMHAAEPKGGDMDYGSRFFINELPVEQRLTLDRATAMLLQGRFDAANQTLCRAWPQIEPADLCPDWERYPLTGNIDRLDLFNEAGPFLRAIIDRLRTETFLEHTRLLAVMSERDMVRGRPETALRSCRDAVGLARRVARVEVLRKPMETLIEQLEARMQRLEAKVAAAKQGHRGAAPLDPPPGSGDPRRHP